MTYVLYKRDRSPYWWARIAQLDSDGRVVGYSRVSTKRTDKAEAKLVAAQSSKTRNDRAQLGTKIKCTIGEAADRYITELTAAGKSSVKDFHVFTKRAKYSNSRLTLSNPIEFLTRTELATLRAQRLNEGYSPAYINNEITFWVTVYNKARNDYDMAVAHDQNFKGLKLETKEKTRYLLDGEEARLLTELDPARQMGGVGEHIRSALQDQYDLVVFLLDSGARYTEVAEVPWTAIDVINWKTVNIYRDKVGNEGTIAMTTRLREILQRRYERNGNTPYVFSGKDPMNPRGYSTRGIRNAIDRAGLNSPSLVKRYGKFTPHSLRHTFASRLVQGGLSLYAVSKLLGHSTTTMTQRYAFLSSSQVAEQAADILNANKG